jgi:Thioredoxin-like [2Fe-2S] ferredoxin
MSKHHHKRICHLQGYLLGWGDDRVPHRYLKLATNDGEKLVKIAKSLRSQIQDWQPSMYLELVVAAQVDRSTGQIKLKVKQFLNSPQLIQQIKQLPTSIPANSTVNLPLEKPSLCEIEPTTIRVCQGSSCRRRGSEQICRSMQAYLTQNDLTEQVKIEPVKCLHQCKAAPHAIVHSRDPALPEKTHYRQLQLGQVPVMLAKHFPIAAPSKPIGSNLIEKIGNYLSQQHISISNNLS